MIEEGISWQKAADEIGVTRRVMSRALTKPHVRQHLATLRKQALDLAVAGNPAALVKLRDTSENAMAQLGAIRTIETVHAESHSPAQYRQGLVQQPGLIIQVISQPPPRISDAAPVRVLEHARLVEQTE